MSLSDDMNVVDELLANAELAPPTLAGEPTERRCYRHKVIAVHISTLPRDEGRTVYHVEQPDDGSRCRPGFICTRCFAEIDANRRKRGRSSRRLGHDGERRSEKRYGWRKTGEFGGIDDLVGTLHVVQQKTTRSAPPLRWKGIFARLDERAAGRIPLILLSFVKAGVDTEDFVVIRGKDWLALHGRDDAA